MKREIGVAKTLGGCYGLIEMSDVVESFNLTRDEALALAEEKGIDVALLDANLDRTVAERISMNEGALQLVRAIERGRKKNGTQPHAAAGAIDQG